MRLAIHRVISFIMFASVTVVAADPGDAWPFFPFDNGVGRGVWKPARQAETVKSLGYEGIHYNYSNPKDFAAKLAACDAAGVPIRAVYLYTFVNKPAAPYDKRFEQVIRMLEGSGTMIWLTLREGESGKNHDAEAVSIIRKISTLAAGSGLKVSIYPHAGFYVATAEDAVRVARLAACPNVGVTVNLCHELFAGNGDRLDEVLKTAAPLLNLVSINGASPVPGKGPKAWETLPLGSGTYDTESFLRQLRDIGYRGPVGHQFHAVPGEDNDKLLRGIESWRKMKGRVLPSTASVDLPNPL